MVQTYLQQAALDLKTWQFSLRLAVLCHSARAKDTKSFWGPFPRAYLRRLGLGKDVEKIVIN
jgi:hypothetical protein